VRKRHTDKHIESALKHAEAEGWTVEISTGGAAHPWATVKCPYNRKTCRNGVWCQFGVWSTPSNPENFAKRIVGAVDKCEVHQQEKARLAAHGEE
jgi:hypothetical protein